MDRTELARRLVDAGRTEQAVLLQQHNHQLDVELAYTIQAICQNAWTSEPARTTNAADCLDALTGYVADDEVHALADWSAGIAALSTGNMNAAIERLNRSAERFDALGKEHTAAKTQVSKLIALALTGRYEEAIATGLRVRDIFVTYGDDGAAGKIEQNLGNLFFRRDQYTEAAGFYHQARQRYERLADANQLTQINVCLAVTMAAQNQFREAAQLYETTLAHAETAGLTVTQAEIECNLGCLALFQGQYDSALVYLEQSRRRYLTLGMPHETAIADLELADAYLELNLAPEAAAIYTRVIPTFADLGMQAEQARALANHGRAQILLGQLAAARATLNTARALFAAEENAVGEAVVTLTEAHLAQLEGNYVVMLDAARRAEAPLTALGAWGRVLLARWMRGEALRALGRLSEAHELLGTVIADAELQSLPQIAQRGYTSLGLLLAATNNAPAAEESLKQAIDIIEELRAPLPAEEFRTAFIADKLTAYAELVRLCLDDGRPERVVEALDYVERARSRALLDILGGALTTHLRSDDPFEAGMLERLATLSTELNWYYSQINHPRNDVGSRSAPVIATLYAAVREREAEILEITRQIKQSTRGVFLRVEPLDRTFLQQTLGNDTALIEYFSLDNELLAFVVTNERIDVVKPLANESAVEKLIDQLHFQINTLRYNPNIVSRHLDQLAERTRHYLGALYDLLLRPLEKHCGSRRLVIVPHRALHYVPFHALHDGQRYVIERCEVSYAPSAGVLRHCFARPGRAWRRAVLLGVPDDYTPHVREEVMTLAPLFADADSLLGEEATIATLRAKAPAADLVHLACHGQFRPDNPQFSALRLADGWLTVRDAYQLDLAQCGLVVLSACETGVSALTPGDDLIGLARGFFSAGAPSLVVSLWPVHDETTAALMREFYRQLHAGQRVGAALRTAQCHLLERHPHPFFWSPFLLLGRW